MNLAFTGELRVSTCKLWGGEAPIYLHYSNVFLLRRNTYFPVEGGINIMNIISNSTNFRTTSSNCFSMNMFSLFISIANICWERSIVGSTIFDFLQSGNCWRISYCRREFIIVVFWICEGVVLWAEIIILGAYVCEKNKKISNYRLFWTTHPPWRAKIDRALSFPFLSPRWWPAGWRKFMKKWSKFLPTLSCSLDCQRSTYHFG